MKIDLNMGSAKWNMRSQKMLRLNAFMLSHQEWKWDLAAIAGTTILVPCRIITFLQICTFRWNTQPEDSSQYKDVVLPV